MIEVCLSSYEPINQRDLTSFQIIRTFDIKVRMQAKLTLSIDKKVIEKAKLFAKSTQRSLSEMVESYLEDITRPSDEILDQELSEIVGVIELPKGFSEKEEIRNVLHEKHMK